MSVRLHPGAFGTGVGPQFLWNDPSNADHTAAGRNVPRGPGHRRVSAEG
jgi:hypothetical protein